MYCLGDLLPKPQLECWRHFVLACRCLCRFSVSNDDITIVDALLLSFLPRNYRPVSLTCITVKILERLIHKSVMSFLDEHEKLSPSQHGFRNRHSCQTQLLQVVHDWAKTLDKRSSTHVVFLDFSKAFDTVPMRDF